MIGRSAAKVRLTAAERAALEAHLRRGSCSRSEEKRGRILLLASDDMATASIAKKVGVGKNMVSRWRGRIARRGTGEDVLQAIADEPRSGRPAVIEPITRMQIFSVACDPMPDVQGLSGSWTLDLLAEELGLREIANVSRSSVYRILNEQGIKPHRHEMWLHSPDPDFRAKVAEIVELYVNPPAGSVVLSFDEKTGVQAIERNERAAGQCRFARVEFEYIRHGTQSLLATLNVVTGEVIADCGPTRKGDDMERHIENVAARYPTGDVHIVLDNLNIHKGDRWVRFNERHGKRFHFHYTPLHASWVNMIEMFFGIVARRSLRRRSFLSTDQLRDHLLAFVERWNTRDKKPFLWKFTGFGAKASSAAQTMEAA